MFKKDCTHSILNLNGRSDALPLASQQRLPVQLRLPLLLLAVRPRGAALRTHRPTTCAGPARLRSQRGPSAAARRRLLAAGAAQAEDPQLQP
jgi:hypothetical protein